MARSRWRLVAVALMLSLSAGVAGLVTRVHAQDSLPPAPTWRGDVVRDAEGNLRVVPFPAERPAPAQSPATAPRTQTTPPPSRPAETRASATPTPLILPPPLPTASAPNDIVAVAIENAGPVPTTPRYLTFGQVFMRGALAADDALTARDTDGRSVPVQMDPLSRWPDGSVKFAAVTTLAPALLPRARQTLMLGRQVGSETEPPLDLAQVPFTLSVDINMTAPAPFTQTIDLRDALTQGEPDLWLQGPLATQGRVDIRIGPTFHVTADITAYKDGSITADVQFNNDIGEVLPPRARPAPPLPPLRYAVTTTLNGKSNSVHIPTQYQYQNWHLVETSNGKSELNVQRDVKYLIKSGAVLPYDLGTGVATSVIQSYQDQMEQSGFGAPLATNGVTMYMGATGGRADIGFTTLNNTVWLLTQNAVMARYGMAQGDTAGAIPWNFKLANGRWLNTEEYPRVWSDGRAGRGGALAPMNRPAVGHKSASGWNTSRAHQPNLSYIPYLMTASRWYLDRLNAQAAWNVHYCWPGPRVHGPYNDLVVRCNQVRGIAWALREIVLAAWIGRDGSWEKAYFTDVKKHNLTWMQSQQDALAAHGATVGAWPHDLGTYTGCAPGRQNCKKNNSENFPLWFKAAPWQQDFLSGILFMAARMGDEQARQIFTWQRGWIIGRFRGPGMNPRDGCNYTLILGEFPRDYEDFRETLSGKRQPTYYGRWSDIADAMEASGITNGEEWRRSRGYYCALARTVLAGLLTLDPTDSDARAAYDWLNKTDAPAVSNATFRRDPTYNIVPFDD